MSKFTKKGHLKKPRKHLDINLSTWKRYHKAHLEEQLTTDGRITHGDFINLLLDAHDLQQKLPKNAAPELPEDNDFPDYPENPESGFTFEDEFEE